MSKKTNMFKLGLFVFGGLAVLIVALILFGSGMFSNKGVVMETYLDESVQGLDIGSPVKYRGVKQGKVSEITFVSSHYENASPEFQRYVLVRVELDSSYTGPRSKEELEKFLSDGAKNGMRVRLAAQGLTGLAYLEVDYLDPASYPPLKTNWTPEVPYVPSAPNVITAITSSIERVAKGLDNANVAKIADNLDKLLVTVEAAVKDAKVGSVSDRVLAFIDEARETNRGVQAVVKDPKVSGLPDQISSTMGEAKDLLQATRSDIVSVTANAKEVVAQVRDMTNRIHEKLEGKGFDLALENMAETLKHSREVSEKLPAVLGRVDESLRRFDMTVTSSQPDLEAISRNLADLSKNVREASELLSQYPSLAVFGEAPPKVEEKKK